MTATYDLHTYRSRFLVALARLAQRDGGPLKAVAVDDIVAELRAVDEMDSGRVAVGDAIDYVVKKRNYAKEIDGPDGRLCLMIDDFGITAAEYELGSVVTNPRV